jgi:hypothetical protein
MLALLCAAQRLPAAHCLNPALLCLPCCCLLAGLGSDMQQQHVESVKQGLQELGHSGNNTVSGDARPPEDQPDRIKYT